MSDTKNLTMCLAVMAGLVFTVISAQAAVTIDPAFSGSYREFSSPTDSAYEGDQSGSDLLNGLTATVATGWNLSSGSTVAELNDGIHGAYPGGNAEGTWSNEGAIVEYNLGSNELGYNISAIQTIASWSDVGFGNQVWTVEVKPVGGSYALLATVDYTPFDNTEGATKVNLSGLNATGIESIRFTAGSTAGNSLGNDFVFREIDVVGAATPSTPDLTAPMVNNLIPADGAGNVSLVDDLVVTFNEIIAIGTGNITIKNLDTLSDAVIPVGDAQVSVFGSVLTINPTVGLDPNANYAIQIDATAITDFAGNAFAGMLDDTTWNFTTGSSNLVKVILLGGQSNAVGQGDNAGLPTSPVNLQLPQDDVLFYYTGPGGGLTTLRPGSGGTYMGTEDKFGVEVTFGREIADANPSVTYAIIKHAESGTALYNDWAPGTGPSYTAFRNTVAAGLAALQNAGYTTEVVGMLWHQGESDALEGQQANYSNNLTAFIADIRSRYGANLPFFIGEIRHNGPEYMTVVNAQMAVAAADPNARFVPATDLSFYDFFHFDAAGLITLGERFATAFLDLVPNDPGTAVTIDPAFSGSFTAVSDASDSAYEGDQSASDLLNGLTATVATGWNTANGSTVAELNDGIHGAFPGGDAEGTWSNEGAIAEYNLGPNAAGYDITSIQSIASWSGSGFGNQVWTVEVKPVGGNYVLLATVNYAPFDNTGGATKVNLTGLDATGIESIRFTAGSTDGKSVGNDFVFREIDVEGTAVPTASHVTIDPAFSGSFTAVSDASDSAYEGDQSASDLLNGLTATTATGWTLSNGAAPAELNDGIHGAFPGGDAEGTWSNEGAIAEYNLGPNAAGYDITSIQSIASWSGSGFGNQVWTVEVKPVGGNYVLLATVNYAPFDNTGGATKVNLTGLDATGIESIRFTAGSTDGKSVGNDFVFREIDVEGTATPEPLRIMCLGDSLTVGYTDNPNWTHPFKFGYRSGLYTRLRNAGYNFRFVGASAEPWNGKSGDPTNGGTYTPALDLRDFGQDGHRGYGGQAIWDNVDAYIAADNPDVILLLIGINGLGSGSQAALTNLVDNIVTTAPDVHLIVAQTSPLASFDQTLYEYNVYIRDTLVPTYAGNGHKVSTVDLYTPFLVDPDNYASAIKPGVLSNSINHPDNIHYELMAQEWFEGIQALDFDSGNFASWISDPAFGLAVADQDFADDSDGDQLGNGLEAWFGTHPGQFNAGVSILSTTGGITTFTHPQNATLPGDLTGYYEWSPNLVDWYLSGNGPDGGSVVTFSTTTTGTTTTVTATASEGLDRIFLRVGVSQN